jgi:site-specific DNA-methyltransferase (adenine-specific)
MSDWRIIDGDCVEVMAGLEPQSVRLVFADPPYKIGVNYGPHFNDAMSERDYLVWCETWLKAAVRLLTPDGSFWLLINWEQVYKLEPIVESLGLHLRQTIIWYERFGENCTRKFNRCTRPLLWFVANPKRFVFNADCPEIRRPSDRQTKYHDPRANPDGKLLDDVWEISRVAGTHGARLKGFPCQLPMKLLRRVVGAASSPNDLVLDPFSGTGTTGAACVESHRRYIGIEKGRDFARRARTRLESVTPLLAPSIDLGPSGSS